MNVVDTHIHLFVRGLPLAPVRRYVPDYDATTEDYMKQMSLHGITHAVIVQPSFLGTDNSFMCQVLRAHPRIFRGIAVVDPTITEGELDKLEADGVVGIRLNLDGLPIPQLGAEPWRGLLQSLAGRQWQVEVHRDAGDLPLILDPLIDAGVNVVVDHFGRPATALGAEDPGFRYLLSMAASGKVWVKLAAPYRNDADSAPSLAAELLEGFGPERLVWGSDWPHTRHESSVSIQKMKEALQRCVPAEADRNRILGETAFELFQFDRGASQ